MRSLLLTLVFFTLLIACKKSNNDNFTRLKINKGQYEIVKKGSDKKAIPGEYIIYSILFKDNHGKVFMDKRKKENYLRERVIKNSVLIKDLTAVSEMLYQLSKGDSAVLQVPLAEDEKINDLKKSDTIFFNIKVIDIVDEEGMRDIIEDEFLKQEAEQVESKIKQIEVDQTIMKTWDEYHKGKLKSKIKHTKNGIKYVVIEKGEGEKVKLAQKVKVGYFGMTDKDANAFDNSFGRGKDLKIVVGANQVIPGWDESLLEMNLGMKAVFFIPYKLAYGNEGKPPVIPPKSDLVFYIELHKIIE